jgi:hypothetical protein
MAMRARLELERLSGPNPARLAAADRTVERAEATLRALRAEGVARGANGTNPARPSGVADPERALQDAIAQRDQILAASPLEEVEAARQADVEAKRVLDDAGRRLELARQGSGPVSIPEADAAVVAAQIAVYDAESRVQTVQSGRP